MMAHHKLGSVGTLGTVGLDSSHELDASLGYPQELLDGGLTRPGSCHPLPVGFAAGQPSSGELYGAGAPVGAHRLSRNTSSISALVDVAGALSRDADASCKVSNPSTEAFGDSPDGSPGVASGAVSRQPAAAAQQATHEQLAEQLIDMYCVPAKAARRGTAPAGPRPSASQPARRASQPAVPPRPRSALGVPHVPVPGWATHQSLSQEGAMGLPGAGMRGLLAGPLAQPQGFPMPAGGVSMAESNAPVPGLPALYGACGSGAVSADSTVQMPSAPATCTRPVSPAPSPRTITHPLWLSTEQQMDIIRCQNKRMLVTVLATWACQCGMNSRKVLQKALLVWLRAAPKLALLRLAEIDHKNPVVVALAACFWIAMKCDGHRRQITKASRLAQVTGCSAAALPRAELYVMELIDWNPYQGLARGIAQQKAEAAAEAHARQSAPVAAAPAAVADPATPRETASIGALTPALAGEKRAGDAAVDCRPKRRCTRQSGCL